MNNKNPNKTSHSDWTKDWGHSRFALSWAIRLVWNVQRITVRQMVGRWIIRTAAATILAVNAMSAVNSKVVTLTEECDAEIFDFKVLGGTAYYVARSSELGFIEPIPRDQNFKEAVTVFAMSREGELKWHRTFSQGAGAKMRITPTGTIQVFRNAGRMQSNTVFNSELDTSGRLIFDKPITLSCRSPYLVDSVQAKDGRVFLHGMNFHQNLFSGGFFGELVNETNCTVKLLCDEGFKLCQFDAVLPVGKDSYVIAGTYIGSGKVCDFALPPTDRPKALLFRISSGERLDWIMFGTGKKSQTSSIRSAVILPEGRIGISGNVHLRSKLQLAKRIGPAEFSTNTVAELRTSNFAGFVGIIDPLTLKHSVQVAKTRDSRANNLLLSDSGTMIHSFLFRGTTSFSPISKTETLHGLGFGFARFTTDGVLLEQQVSVLSSGTLYQWFAKDENGVIHVGGNALGYGELFGTTLERGSKVLYWATISTK